tara:strand:+ start:280 stop:621 length:342 start_codon:yes stop_codon:yes gene_type:complete
MPGSNRGVREEIEIGLMGLHLLVHRGNRTSPRLDALALASLPRRSCRPLACLAEMELLQIDFNSEFLFLLFYYGSFYKQLFDVVTTTGSHIPYIREAKEKVKVVVDGFKTSNL